VGEAEESVTKKEQRADAAFWKHQKAEWRRLTRCWHGISGDNWCKNRYNKNLVWSKKSRSWHSACWIASHRRKARAA